VVPVLADWSKSNAVISQMLHEYGRASIPYYLVIPGEEDAPAIELPVVLTGPGKIIEAITKAAGAVEEG
jgi:thiol:disulfide interchange protein